MLRALSNAIAGILLLQFLAIGTGQAQQLPASQPAAVDLVDEARNIFPRLAAHDSLALQHGRKSLLLIPVVGYTQQTSGVAEIAVNMAFERPSANMSTLVAAGAYTLNQQLILTATSSVWAKDNRWNFVGDWRLMHYPQSTFGLGMYTSTTERVVSMNYEHFRFYQSANLSRGFIQGRFRGKNLIYGETEYRFGLTRNRLLGAVVFANAESVTEQESGRFEKVVPAAGAGLRVSVNKVSHTNLSIDYGFGTDGSRGLALNLGEVF
ncbi:hypothetical protein [Hymenobacter terricola]|uniref:hypothetical protein n=1 Tax=Hymenobacter terricola TaxID=2819236 RepID=UPI001CF5B609|nr:hypothetical protein [Hymenobacter terricola]